MPEVDYTVRPTNTADVPALDAFLAPFVKWGRLLPRTLAELEDLTANGFVAVHGEQFVGFAALEVYSPKLAELRSLAVSPDHQGKGIGKALVGSCVALAKTRHVFEVMAITSSDEFFHRCGFDFTLPGERKALFLQTRPTY